MIKVHAYRIMKFLLEDMDKGNVAVMGNHSQHCHPQYPGSEKQLEDNRICFIHIIQGSYVYRKVSPDRC